MLYASPSNAGHTWRLFPSLTRLDDLGESTHVRGQSMHLRSFCYPHHTFAHFTCSCAAPSLREHVAQIQESFTNLTLKVFRLCGI